MKLQFTITIFALFLSVLAVPVQAQTADSETPETLENPLEITTEDPLFPLENPDRPLTPTEAQTLETIVEELDAQATAQINADNPDTAFQIWYRELRLRRSLGLLAETKALGRVGSIAWQQNRTPDVKNINERLNAITQEVRESNLTANQEILTALAQAYEQIRAADKAAKLYEEVLENAKTTNDERTVEQTLVSLGELYLAWFRYPEAAEVYTELLALVRSQQDDFNTMTYLEELAYIYDQLAQPENAIDIKQQLLASYLKKQETAKILTTQITLARDYAAINRPNEAISLYEQAFTLAWEERHMSYASEALKNQAQLYETYEQPDDALKVYAEQVKVQEIASDFYGLMDTYDRVGQIYLQQQSFEQAIAFFQEGLEIAESLGYREAYFEAQIRRSLTRQNRS
ncbi:MAG: tetratricopeptide repeat protein [Jaaginema sp. PMC 1079.18]|nr:tetratricopeptide repeat protein [Jaaginema sp. PMC 1080.18]MEC4852061.1 tetratricopeptide repeat protein [Jaaginema sp. PMC 1079.18]MEC4866469.1 tetratricopeptide repeat protein [Jaaginema sp. PMC 1078.18]